MTRARTLARLSLFLLVPVLALSGLGSGSPSPSLREEAAVAPVLAAAQLGGAAGQPAVDAPASEPEAGKPADKPSTNKPSTEKSAAMAQTPAAAAEPAAAEASATPRTLYLAIGHGLRPDGRLDPGAENLATGAFEIDAATIMVEAMVEVLEDAPNLELTAESGDHPNVLGSVAAANSAGVDDCIEVHQDSAAAPPGAFAHWYPGSSSAQTLADQMIGGIREAGLDTRTDWHRPRPGLYWLRKSDCRAVLLEIGRVGDFSEETLRTFGRSLAHSYLANTAEARGVATG